MLELGLIRQSATGLYHLLPLAQRSLDKLISIINKNMQDIGAQKISMPVLIQSKLWKKSGLLLIEPFLYCHRWKFKKYITHF